MDLVTLLSPLWGNLHLLQSLREIQKLWFYQRLARLLGLSLLVQCPKMSSQKVSHIVNMREHSLLEGIDWIWVIASNIHGAIQSLWGAFLPNIAPPQHTLETQKLWFYQRLGRLLGLSLFSTVPRDVFSESKSHCNHERTESLGGDWLILSHCK